ncbi:MAG TPA: hypothetical protein VMK16_00835 [Acidimicrobiales bacterium]|nr:hypothetical protein [Acidimicrobiales bacterium]
MGAEESPSSIEPRWPLAIVLFGFIAMTILLRVLEPDREHLGPVWLVPTVEIALLFALLAADPMHIARRTKWLRPIAITLIVTLLGMVILSDAILIQNLIKGSKLTQSAGSLLASGALVWAGNALAFGLLYWELDSGGPLARYRGDCPYPDFAFSQQLGPELAPPNWRPHYVDYFILGITTSTAFSPTDVMPMKAWSKLTMAAQSLISLTVLGLVVARAVNAFT